MCVIINPQVAVIQLSNSVTFYLVTLETVSWPTAPCLAHSVLHLCMSPYSLAHCTFQLRNEALVPSPVILSPVSRLVILWHMGLKSLPACGPALSPWVSLHLHGPGPPLCDSRTGPGTEEGSACVERIIRLLTFGLFICWDRLPQPKYLVFTVVIDFLFWTLRFYIDPFVTFASSLFIFDFFFSFACTCHSEI